MLKIAFLLPNLAQQGPIIVIRNLIEELLKKDCYCECFYFNDWLEIEMPCKSTRISFIKRHNFDNFDLIHSNMLKPDLYVFVHQLSKKTVVTIHQFFYPNLKYQYGRVIARILEYIWIKVIKNDTSVVAISNSLYIYLQKNFMVNNVTTIYNGVNNTPKNFILDNNINTLKEFKGSSKLIGTISLLIKRKAISLIIESLLYLPDFKLCIIGDGDEFDSLNKLVSVNGLKDRVIFLGFQKNTYPYLKYFDIFVTASYSEGFGLSLVEAAAEGLPAVCSPLEVFRELFTSDEVVFFEKFDQRSIALAVVDAYQRKNELAVTIKRAFNERFTSKIMAKNYLELYQKLLKKVPDFT